MKLTFPAEEGVPFISTRWPYLRTVIHEGAADASSVIGPEPSSSTEPCPDAPRDAAAEADLKALLSGEGSYVYLTIRDELNAETVRCSLSAGALVLERGMEGTQGVRHPYGACVSTVSPTVMAVVKDLICHYDCCEGGDCTAVPVALHSVNAPSASVGAPWQGSAELDGSDPITLDASAAPSWMTVRRYGHLVLMKGTPSTAGNVSFTLYAVNLNGTESASAQIAFTVS